MAKFKEVLRLLGVFISKILDLIFLLINRSMKKLLRDLNSGDSEDNPKK